MSAAKQSRGMLNRVFGGKRLGYSLLLPTFIVFVAVLLYPILYSFAMSLSNVNIKDRTLEFTGLANYARLFSDTYFQASIVRTLLFTLISVAAEICLGLGIAVVLNKEFKGRGFVRGVMILPWALPSVVNAVMWTWIFDGNYGALNALLTQLGLIDSYRVWLGSSTSAFASMLFANIWKETPYVVLLTIAALANVNKTLYESARVDGAGSIRTFFRITLPIIRPVVIILTITKSIWAIQTFDLVYILTSGGPAASTELIAYYIYKTTFKFNNFGYASVMSYVLSMVTFLLTFLYIKFLSRDNELI